MKKAFSDIDPDKFLSQDNAQYKAMFEFYKENPTMACMDLLKQDLPAFQRKVIHGNLNHLFTLNVMSRGSGKTRMIAMIAALEAIFNPNKRIGFLAPQFRNSKLCFTEFKNILNESELLQASVKKISQQPDTWEAEFFNGARITATPLAAESKMSIRGIRLHTALIDEYPHIAKEVLDAVITPMLATQLNPMANVRRRQKEKMLLEKGLIKKEDIEAQDRNRVSGFSSAYFRYNHMYQTMMQYRELAKLEKAKTGKTDYAVYVFNYKDGPEGFFDEKMIEHARQTSPEVIFAMEWLSEFPMDSSGFFKRSLLDSCISKQPNSFFLELKGEKGCRYVMGIDPARNHDAFAISILKLVNGEMRLVRVVSFEKTALPLVVTEIRKLLKLYDVFMIGMDAGGGGLAVKDMLADPMSADTKEDIILDMNEEGVSNKIGRPILKMIDFSSQWITQANFSMKSSLEHKRLMFPNLHYGDTYIKPEDSDDIDDTSVAEYFKTIEEIQSIVMTAKTTGSLHFDTENSRMRKDRYTSTLIAHDILYEFIKQGFQPKELAMGGFLGNRGIIQDNEDHVEWKETKIIDQIREAAKEKYSNFENAGL